MVKTRPQNSIVTDLETIVHTKLVRMFMIHLHTKLYTSCSNVPLIIFVQTKNYSCVRLAGYFTISAQKYFNNFCIFISIHYVCIIRLFFFLVC